MKDAGFGAPKDESSKVLIRPPTFAKACFGFGVLLTLGGSFTGIDLALTTDRNQSLALKLAGLALVAANLYLMLWSVEYFGKNNTPVCHGRKAQKLVKGGPFFYTRNPMYVGMVGLIGSVSLLANSWWFLIASSPLYLYLQYLVVPIEENHLFNSFENYEEYAKKTPRWIL
eukprot:CAMPEP_0204891702 /NCGR_PEP_ID=MMETSP1349-20130617/27838_1 /ASSEMBLY_ACC=CAM_ASM_000710 /TAXON_ID=215587 /ORGANISM="Aplanochytrium stocchinoi, Strain GSBS06" /LENGTH=170 /DNA_ID=CAMNT_0052057233 /DNA_START=200 /DNA_END=712 /DNA_ORIENTATION=+